MAVRSRLSTMMMRVKPVIINSMAGRKESMVSRTGVSTVNDQVWLPSAAGVEVNAGSVAWAATGSGKASSRASSRPGRNRRIMVSLLPLECAAQRGCEAGRIGRRGAPFTASAIRGAAGGQGVQQGDLLGRDTQHQAGVFHLDNGHPGAAAQVLRSEDAQGLRAGASCEARATYRPCAGQYHHQDEHQGDDDAKYVGFAHGSAAAAQPADAVGRRDDVR